MHLIFCSITAKLKGLTSEWYSFGTQASVLLLIFSSKWTGHMWWPMKDQDEVCEKRTCDLVEIHQSFEHSIPTYRLSMTYWSKCTVIHSKRLRKSKMSKINHRHCTTFAKDSHRTRSTPPSLYFSFWPNFDLKLRPKLQTDLLFADEWYTNFHSVCTNDLHVHI